MSASSGLQQRGLTLIELLVTVAIIGIITTLLTLNAGHWLSDATAQTEAQRLRHKIQALSDQAVITQMAVGLVLQPDTILIFQHQPHRQDPWQEQRPPITLAAGMRLLVPLVTATDSTAKDDTKPEPPDIALYLGPDGRATPLRLGLEDTHSRCYLNINTAVGITLSDCTGSPADRDSG